MEGRKDSEVNEVHKVHRLSPHAEDTGIVTLLQGGRLSLVGVPA